MDGYPGGSLDHNVPFIVASGLNATPSELPLSQELREQAILIKSELPPLETREADVLEAYFDEIDARGVSWKPVSKDEGYRLRIKTLGRSLLLPPRRARLPETDDEPPSTTPVLHSPFSPLSPVSSLYHDGLIDEQWINKHQQLVPSIFLSFYTLTNDPSDTSQADNRLKADLNNLKLSLVRSGYKTRLAIIMMGTNDHGPMPISEAIQERLEAIRRGAALDPKSIFYIPPQDSPSELKAVIDNILGVLYTTAIEYYRDVGRHARKKRARGVTPAPSVPPTSGTSHTLSLPDWNFRYDFKAGVLAEFRQEPDAAIRSFEQAYEILLGQDVLDVIPSWSSRWNDARLLADVIAIRCLRLHFWMGHTSMAVRRWQLHRDRISEFVERRGKGTNCYGWQAWEARWATVMASLISKLEIPGLTAASDTLYLQPEKSLAGERLQPWELLHHVGYWHRIAARHLSARRVLAHTIPDEDRVVPDAASKHQQSSHAYSYDTYLCPEPWEEYPLESGSTGANHAKLIVDALIAARREFAARSQERFCAEIDLEIAKEHAHLEEWTEAITVLQGLWEQGAFRGEEWTDVAADLCWSLRRAAGKAGRADLVVAADWELMNRKFTKRPQWHYDLSKSLDGIDCPSKPIISLAEDTVPSFVTANFVFRTKESKAGDTCAAQLSLTSKAFPDAAPLELHSIRIEPQGAMRPITLEHEASESPRDGRLVVLPTPLREEETSEEGEGNVVTQLRGSSDLTLLPGQTRVFELGIPLREDGEAEVKSLVLCYRSESFDLDYILKLSGAGSAGGWYTANSIKPTHSRPNAHILQIQPRPPKMEVKLVDTLEQYYANEPLELRLELLNAEDEAANVRLEVQLGGKAVSDFKVRIGDDSEESMVEASGDDEVRIVRGMNVGRVDKSETKQLVLMIDPADAPTIYDLQIKAAYHLESDPATPILQALTHTMNIVNAFEANYDLAPRLHPEPWPSLFDPDGVQDMGQDATASAASHIAKGLAQRWALKCHYASFAVQDIQVVGLDTKIVSAIGGGGAKCEVTSRPDISSENGGILMAYKTMHDASFEIEVRKMTLDDRAPVSLELAFVIRWRRAEAGPDGPINETTLPVGKYLVLGTEPRVLATVTRRVEDGEDEKRRSARLMYLTVTIENPSHHFLTFGLGMEPSDEFAFSGAKSLTVHLLPLARRSVTYRLLPLVRGGDEGQDPEDGEGDEEKKGSWIRPGLTVRDKYFQKVLRVIPGEGMGSDKEGLVIWVPAEDE